ncbi:MAG: PAS domain S-box protein [Oscillatoriales cyanobacterium RM1_1_9]|nr:PAS domain S-box protein [Oscillatoriales cyanobacterium RM1_1_9]
MKIRWLSSFQEILSLRTVLKSLRDTNAIPEYYNNLTQISYKAWRDRIFKIRLDLAFELAIFKDMALVVYNFGQLLQGESLGILVSPIIRLLSLMICFVLLQTPWGKRNLSLLFINFSWCLILSEEFFIGEKPIFALDWSLTFFTLAILVPISWRLHLLAQVTVLGGYFLIRPDVSLLDYNFLKIFWICFICDISVYLYERLQRRVFKSRQELEIAYQELGTTETKYRSIFENSVEGLFQSLPNGQFIDVNRTFAHIYGYNSPEEMLDQITDIGQQIYVDPDRRAEFIQLTSQQEYALAFESQVYRADGTVIWISENARAVRDSAGKIVSYEGGVQDITERKLAESEIYKALQQEKELNQLKSRLVSTVSHEFRTPLTTILGAAEALEHYGDRWNETKKIAYLNRIQSTVQHMDKLLTDVLLISQAEAYRLPFQPGPVDLELFSRNLIEEIEFRLEKHHRIVFLPERTPLDLQNIPCMDERLLRQILGNLLSNAIKYSPRGGVIEFKLSYDQDRAIFTVKDQGIGIPEQDLKHLFASFHRSKNVGTIPGTGLGLAIVKRSVEIHGGEITVQSQVGKGTLFIVSLPLFYAQEPDSNEANCSH